MASPDAHQAPEQPDEALEESRAGHRLRLPPHLQGDLTPRIPAVEDQNRPGHGVSLVRKRLIAAEFVNGASISELSQRHGYSYRGMCRLLRSRTLSQILEEERVRVLQAAERTRVMYLMNMEALGATMLQTALNPQHPRAFDANKFIQERFLSAKTSSEVNVNLNVDPETVRELGDALRGLKAAYRGEVTTPAQEPKLLEGREVFPQVVSDVEEEILEAPELVVQPPEEPGPGESSNR